MTKTFANQSETPIILASGSAYRKALLSRLGMSFKVISPDVDESVLPDETPQATCIRLAHAKANVLANAHPDAIVIGSDQVAVVNGQAVSKPGTHENAVVQLQAMSGKTIVFHSAVAVLADGGRRCEQFCVPTSVSFRELSDAEIHRYLLAEKPYDCAGSAKSEGLGITLLHSIQSNDPTALIGLPLIELSRVLRGFGCVLP
jgi:septum formation protein